MADISISPLAPREFRVQVREGDRETTHQVTVPEREPATSILAPFSLSDIGE